MLSSYIRCGTNILELCACYSNQLFQTNPRSRVHRHARTRMFVDKDVCIPSHRSWCILASRRNRHPVRVSSQRSEHPDFVRDRALSQPCHPQTEVEHVWERKRGEKLGGRGESLTYNEISPASDLDVPRRTTIPQVRSDSRSRPNRSQSVRVRSVGRGTC